MTFNLFKPTLVEQNTASKLHVAKRKYKDIPVKKKLPKSLRLGAALIDNLKVDAHQPRCQRTNSFRVFLFLFGVHCEDNDGLGQVRT